MVQLGNKTHFQVLLQLRLKRKPELKVLKATGHTLGATWKRASLAHGGTLQLCSSTCISLTLHTGLQTQKKKGCKKRIQNKSTCPLAAQRASADATRLWKRLLLDSGTSEAVSSITFSSFTLKSSEGPSHFANCETTWD